jgi:hypothetical protein
MTPLASRIIFLLLLGMLEYTAHAQKRTPSAAWLFPGVSWQSSKNVRLQGQLGYNNYYRMGIFYPQAFITVHKNIILNPAYIYAVQKSEDAPTVQEHWLFNAIILQAARKQLLVDDRNLLWNRFTVGASSTHYYRNRLRVAQSFKAWGATTRLYAFDEIFYLFNNKELSRNRAAFGISSELTPHTYVDVTYIRQWDRYAGPLNLFFITGTLQL